MKNLCAKAVPKLKPISVAIIFAFGMGGCVSLENGKNYVASSLNNIFNNEDPCSNNARNIGTVAGTVGGVMVAKSLGLRSDDVVAVTIGAAGLGAVIGNLIDKRKCELHKIQQKHALEMRVVPIKFSPDSKEEIGLSVAVVDQGSKPQFAKGQFKLNADAEAAYKEIALQYSSKNLDGTDEKSVSLQKDVVRKRRVLIVGHTDDTGSTKQNAILSEKRAKQVALIFERAGVPKENIFYQGAGESLPVASNETDAGRAANRRVEIVDLSDEEKFDKYLESRRPDTSLYRTTRVKIASHTPKNGNTDTVPADHNQPASAATVGYPRENVVAMSRKLPSDIIDFGGVPVSQSNATLEVGSNTDRSLLSFPSIFISEANADDLGSVMKCSEDRPRTSGPVKSLDGDKHYKTVDYMPMMYGNSWKGKVGNHLIVLNKVKVLRDELTPFQPELKIYVDYYPKADRSKKEDLLIHPEVNVYKGNKGMLYRVFGGGVRGFQCMDMLIPSNKNAGSDSNKAIKGKVIYGALNNEYVADFMPEPQ